MKPASFEYLEPKTAREAVDLLVRYGDQAKLIAGGQSLVPLMNMRLARPDYLIDLNGVAALNYVRREGDVLAIGAMTRHHTVETSPLIREQCPLLAEAAANIGHLPIRHRGTIGGSLCHADPSAEMPAALAVLGGSVRLLGPAGERTVAAEDFFVTFLTTAVQPDEVLVEVRVPVRDSSWGWAFEKVTRTQGTLAIASALALLRLDGQRVADVGIALAGVGPGPVKAKGAEQALRGKAFTDQAVEEAAAAAAAAADPETDLHASAEYRRHAVGVLVKRALLGARQRIGGGR